MFVSWIHQLYMWGVMPEDGTCHLMASSKWYCRKTFYKENFVNVVVLDCLILFRVADLIRDKDEENNKS